MAGVDGAGRVHHLPTTATWFVDVDVPSVSIVAGPSDGSWGSHTPSGDVIVVDVVDSSSLGTSVEMLLELEDGAPSGSNDTSTWSRVTTGRVVVIHTPAGYAGLATVHVRAVDAVGRYSPEASHSWEVE